jgi:dolichyl-phosphate-mannose-protein mannosyltransferase
MPFSKPWQTVLLILVLSVSTRLLWFNAPNEVVFDEVHFGKYASAYCCTHQRFFDLHPPHGKLLTALVLRLSPYDGQFPFAQIGQGYPGYLSLWVRLIPYLTGCLLPILFFLTLLKWEISPPLALLGGLFLVFENALVVESRFFMLDGHLLFFEWAALLAFF